MHGLTSSPTWLLKSQQHEQGKVDDHFAIEHEQLQCRKCMKMPCFNVFCLSFSHPRMGMSASEAQVGLFLCKSLFASGGCTSQRVTNFYALTTCHLVRTLAKELEMQMLQSHNVLRHICHDVNFGSAKCAAMCRMSMSTQLTLETLVCCESTHISAVI